MPNLRPVNSLAPLQATGGGVEEHLEEQVEEHLEECLEESSVFCSGRRDYRSLEACVILEIRALYGGSWPSSNFSGAIRLFAPNRRLTDRRSIAIRDRRGQGTGGACAAWGRR